MKIYIHDDDDDDDDGMAYTWHVYIMMCMTYHIIYICKIKIILQIRITLICKIKIILQIRITLITINCDEFYVYVYTYMHTKILGINDCINVCTYVYVYTYMHTKILCINDCINVCMYGFFIP